MEEGNKDLTPNKKFTLKELFIGKTTNNTIQLIRNAIVEGSRIAINLMLLWICYDLIMNQNQYNVTIFNKEFDLVLTICTIIASMLSGIANYIFSTIWVFHKKQKGNNISRFIVFTLIGAVGLGINAGITVFLTKTGINYLISNLIAQIIVFFFNFVMRKKIVYTLMSKEKQELKNE
ncbi:MAG: GtrA family protein [Bacteroidales bacterium]|nr:GtrA family protein [Bacteroidales bacterium]